MLVTEERQIKIISMNWEKKSVRREEVRANHADYYCRNGFEVTFSDPEQRDKGQYQKKSESREYLLLIKTSRSKYSFGLKR